MTHGYPDLAQLTMKTQFYRQDALMRPNLTQCGPNLAQIYVTLQWQQERHHQWAAREARRPLVTLSLFLLSLQCHVDLCQVRSPLGQVRSRECVLSIKQGCHRQLCQVHFLTSPKKGSQT